MPGIKLGWGQSEELMRALLAEANKRGEESRMAAQIFDAPAQPQPQPPSQYGAQGAWGAGAQGAWGAQPQTAEEMQPWPPSAPKVPSLAQILMAGLGGR